MIIMLDDEPFRIQPWREALRNHFGESKVKYLADAEELLPLIEKGQAPDVLILDVMLPAPREMTSAVSVHGSRTGVAFLKRLRQDWPNTPVLLFTNLSDFRLEDVLDRKRGDRLLHKFETDPEQLVEAVEAMQKEKGARPSKPTRAAGRQEKLRS